MREPRVALATYAKAPSLAPDDQALVPALAAVGVAAAAVEWSRPDAPWAEFDGIVVRSCWDYHRRIGEFHAWLDGLDRAGIRVWNAPDVLRWNADKSYLEDLARRGAPTIPTLRIPRGAGTAVEAAVEARGWTHVVIKPCVSASGYETHALRLPFDQQARETVGRVTALGDMLVQPFVDEIPRDGEYSFVFLDGEYSHAALKRATGSEFRVQEEHGGTLSPIAPLADLIAQARRVVDRVDADLLYARVDGIVRGDTFLLMELELIEPNLFLGMRAGAAAALAQAIAHRLAM